MADEERKSNATQKKKKKKITKKKPVTLKNPSIRKDKNLINKYHAIKKLQEVVKKDHQLSSDAKSVKLKDLNAKLEKLGGIDAYQEASRLGEKRYGGFNSAKWVLEQLKENGVQAGKDQKLGLLDVGALSCNYMKQKSWINCTSIDLNPQNSMIMKADFLHLDSRALQYDVVVLSLVINFEGDPVKRGEMLKQCARIVRHNGYLFIVLPLPCLMNSRFFSKKLFLSMTESLGFERIAHHSSRRLYFAMFKNTGNANLRPFPRKTIRKEPVEFSVPKPYTPSYRHSLTNMTGQIDKNIYSSETTDYTQLAPPSKALPLGTLSFKVEYESYEQKLTIHLINAKRLPVRHHVNKVGEGVDYVPVPCDVKVLICLLPGEKETLESSVQEDNRDPVFDETFVISISKQDLRKSMVRFTVYDSRRLHHLCPIGHALYSLKAQDLDGATEVQREIKPQSQTNGHSWGQLYLSLQYVSDSRVVLKIIKAQDILHFEKTCFKEYYVKVCHIHTDRKLKTKRSSTVEGKRNMVFDSSFSFHIGVSDLSSSCLVVSLVNYGIVRGSRSVGRVILGPYVMEGESDRRHWGKMIAAPNEPLSQWHSLYL